MHKKFPEIITREMLENMTTAKDFCTILQKEHVKNLLGKEGEDVSHLARLFLNLLLIVEMMCLQKESGEKINSNVAESTAFIIESINTSKLESSAKFDWITETLKSCPDDKFLMFSSW